MGARGGQGVPDCLAARGWGVWECTSSVKGMAVKAAKLAPAIINYAAPLSWGRASAWYVLPEALDLDRGLPSKNTLKNRQYGNLQSLFIIIGRGQEDALQKHTHSQRMLCLVRPVDSSSDAEWGDMGGCGACCPCSSTLQPYYLREFS